MARSPSYRNERERIRRGNRRDGWAALVDEHFTAVLREFSRGQSDDLRGHLDNVPGLPASTEVSMTVMTALLDGFASMWPDMPEDEAVEVITRFVYRALNGKDYE